MGQRACRFANVKTAERTPEVFLSAPACFSAVLRVSMGTRMRESGVLLVNAAVSGSGRLTSTRGLGELGGWGL